MAHTYKQTEAALARVHAIPDQHRSSLAARLLHLKRLGLVPATPGKGKKVVYRREDVMFWSLCLEMEQVAIDPAVIRDFVGPIWKVVRDVLLGTVPDPNGDDWLLSIVPSMIAPPLVIGGQDLRISFSVVTAPVDLLLSQRRITFLNLSRLRHETDAALEAVADLPVRAPRGVSMTTTRRPG